MPLNFCVDGISGGSGYRADNGPLFADQLVASHYIGEFKDEGTPRPEDIVGD